MGVREFIDDTGIRWRVWDTTPESLHPATKAEDYMQALGSGWLTFERSDGSEKRRLAPVPGGWEDATDAELDRLRRGAERVRADSGHWRKYSGAPGAAPSPPTGAEAGSATSAPGFLPADAICSTEQRSFLYPGGRLWSVCEVRTVRPDGTGAVRTALRFISGARHLDLLTWPADWAQYTTPQLVGLLRRAFPREPGRRNPTDLNRRFDDARS
ncbi:MAG: hypothetical protein NVS4B3_24790 [Gemmatimonadaceae bacterium]